MADVAKLLEKAVRLAQGCRTRKVHEQWPALESLINALADLDLADVGWTEVEDGHFTRGDGAEVWRIKDDFGSRYAGSAGRWYGETADGLQTPNYATAGEAKAVVGITTKCTCMCGCSKEAGDGWPKCSSCMFNDHHPRG